MSTQPEDSRKQLRNVSIVVVVTTLLWLLVNRLGQGYGWQNRWAYLADLAAIAAYIWSFLVALRIWRHRKE